MLSTLWLGGCSVFGIRGTEEPAYRVLAPVGAIELRAYSPRLAAETIVDGSEVGARSAGFRRIASYIFGANHTRATIAMTAPVEQAGAPGQAIGMTAPVAQSPAGPGAWRIRFFMPAGATLQSLPQPDDPLVSLLPEPAETVAVLRFSGMASPASVAEQSAALLHGLAGSGWTASGPPVTWFYDPPWTLPPLRRNEAAVIVHPSIVHPSG